MSHLSADNSPLNRPRQNANANANANANEVQVSNQTSGHFLGTVPRNWMLHQGNNSIANANKNSTSQRRTTLTDTSTKNTVTKRAAPAESPVLQTQNVPEAVQPTPNRPAVPRARSDEHSNGAFIQVSNTNSNASDSNSLTVQPITEQSAPIPASDASPINCTAAVPRSLPTLENHLATGSSAARSMNNHNMPPLRPIMPSPQISQPLRLNISPNMPMNGCLIIPTNLSLGRPSGSQQPQTLQSTSPATMGFPIRSFPQPHPTGPFTPLRPTSISQPHVLRSLTETKERLVKDNCLSSVDAIRFAWLYDACQSGDEFYVLLHQLTCIWTHHTGEFTNSLGLSPEHVKGLSVLNHILKDNRQLSSKALTFLANFPRDVQIVFSDRSVVFAQWMAAARLFLQILTLRWPLLTSQVAYRKCPPSARELAEILNLDSPVLSRAIYTSFFYNLFPDCTQSFIGASFNLFRTSQENLAYRIRSGIINTDRDMNSGLESFGFQSKFHELVRTLCQRSPTSSSPGFNGNLDPNTHNNIRTPPRLPSGPITVIGAPASGHSLFARSGPDPTKANPSASVSRLFPRAGQLLPIVMNPTPKRNALHQAHLFDPSMEYGHREEDLEHNGKMFSFLERLTGALRVITTATVFQVWSILIPAEMFERRVEMPPVQMDNTFAKQTRLARNTSILFNLRCVQLKSDVDSLSESEYSAEPTSWPSHVFISVNDTHLEFRRKIHYGRDLPVDVTQFVRQGSNDIHLSYHPSQLEIHNERRFAIGLEAVIILTYDAVLRMPVLLDATSSRNMIAEQAQRLNIEDDIVMADTDISIDLIDPFTARIFEQPVRGISCRHRECFDLEAFLKSRNTRSKDNFVHANEWKCPICGKDARPGNLIIDGFLLQVREKLVADGLMDTKAILFKEDGTWVPKAEVASCSATDRNQRLAEPQPLDTSDDAKDAKEDGAVSDTNRHSMITAAEPQIIVLDDDEQD